MKKTIFFSAILGFIFIGCGGDLVTPGVPGQTSALVKTEGIQSFPDDTLVAAYLDAKAITTTFDGVNDLMLGNPGNNEWTQLKTALTKLWKKFSAEEKIQLPFIEHAGEYQYYVIVRPYSRPVTLQNQVIAAKNAEIKAKASASDVVLDEDFCEDDEFNFGIETDETVPSEEKQYYNAALVVEFNDAATPEQAITDMMNLMRNSQKSEFRDMLNRIKIRTNGRYTWREIYAGDSVPIYVNNGDSGMLIQQSSFDIPIAVCATGNKLVFATIHPLRALEALEDNHAKTLASTGKGVKPTPMSLIINIEGWVNEWAKYVERETLAAQSKTALAFDKTYADIQKNVFNLMNDVFGISQWRAMVMSGDLKLEGKKASCALYSSLRINGEPTKAMKAFVQPDCPFVVPEFFSTDSYTASFIRIDFKTIYQEIYANVKSEWRNEIDNLSKQCKNTTGSTIEEFLASLQGTIGFFSSSAPACSVIMVPLKDSRLYDILRKEVFSAESFVASKDGDVDIYTIKNEDSSFEDFGAFYFKDNVMYLQVVSAQSIFTGPVAALMMPENTFGYVTQKQDHPPLLSFKPVPEDKQFKRYLDNDAFYIQVNPKQPTVAQYKMICMAVNNLVKAAMKDNQDAEMTPEREALFATLKYLNAILPAFEKYMHGTVFKWTHSDGNLYQIEFEDSCDFE